MPISADAILYDAARLIAARGPGGREDEVAALCRERLGTMCDEVANDPAGNVVGLILGRSREPGIKVMAHMDELCLYVKRIEGDGRLSVRQQGAMTTGRFGDGPVEILADNGDIIPGIVGLGPRHTAENAAVQAARKGRDPGWELARVITRLSKEELQRRGVRAGTPVVLAGCRRGLFRFADCVGTHFLDDRAAIAVMLAAGEELRRDGPPPCDIRLIATRLEETGGGPAAHAAARLPGEILLAIEVIPAAPEYDVALDAMPAIVARDGITIYTASVCRALADAAAVAGAGCRFVALEQFGSDASNSHKVGNAARIGCIGFPTDNTHGFEVCLPEALVNCAKLLAAYLRAGGAPRA